jgi:hypothetical protein
VPVDLERLLREVVSDVVADDAEARYERVGPQDFQVELHSTSTGQRRFKIRSTQEWCTGSVPELGVSVTLFEYDKDAVAKAAPLRELAHVAKAYLRGEGTVERRSALLGRRNVLTVEVRGRIWRLGRRTATHSFP